MASNIAPDSDENARPRIPDIKILPYVSAAFEELKKAHPNRKFLNINGLYQDYEQGCESLIATDFSVKIRAAVRAYLLKYEEDIALRPDTGDEGNYNRYKFLSSVMDEASEKGEKMILFSVFLAIAIPTVFMEDGLEELPDVITAVELYMGLVGESLEVAWDSLNQLADAMVMQLIAPVYRTLGTYTPENESALEDGEGGSLVGMSAAGVAEFRNFRLRVFQRDNYTCAVTGKHDTDAETGTVSSRYKVAHIIPWRLDWNTSRVRAVKNQLGWNLLDIFDATPSGRLSDSVSRKLHKINNGLTLDREVHRRFTGLQLWLSYYRETSDVQIYTIGGNIDELYIAPDRKVAFQKGYGSPERRLLDIHARISKVATTSRAINLVKKYTGQNAKAYVKHGPDILSIDPDALRLRLLGINGATEDL
ncbi:hypothetical protein TWF730_007785 [Orbilia blumenaviensis]|uniref:HNH nuclease domain-containing protein n=1 Tax=Orbilia blumenaviensis TaxID=1796055 RepID=A0AAV9V916_9PEZI